MVAPVSPFSSPGTRGTATTRRTVAIDCDAESWIGFNWINLWCVYTIYCASLYGGRIGSIAWHYDGTALVRLSFSFLPMRDRCELNSYMDLVSCLDCRNEVVMWKHIATCANICIGERLRNIRADYSTTSHSVDRLKWWCVVYYSVSMPNHGWQGIIALLYWLFVKYNCNMQSCRSVFVCDANICRSRRK